MGLITHVRNAWNWGGSADQKMRRARMYSRYRGLLYVTSNLSATALLAVAVASLLYWWLTSARYTFEVAATYWSIPKYLLFGAIALTCVTLIPWVLVPLFFGALNPGPQRYVFRQDTWGLRLLLIALLS